MKACYQCGAPWEETPGSQPGKRESCSKCGADIHCCRNCRLFDPSAANQCLSRTVEAVREKEKANYCDEFDFSVSRGEKGQKPPKNDMEQKWGDLFQ